eukprot:8985569-Karenia_brevis.AAC.1
MATLGNMKVPGKGEELQQRGKRHRTTSEENPQMREATGQGKSAEEIHLTPIYGTGHAGRAT